MPITSKKHEVFIAEPMGIKKVTKVPGVHKVLGKRLGEKGFDNAYVILGQYLILRKDQNLFIEWMKQNTGANNKQAADCYNSLHDWSQQFL